MSPVLWPFVLAGCAIVGSFIAWAVVAVADALGLCYNPNRERAEGPPPRFRQRGQGLAEYALIISLVALVAIIALVFLGGQVSKLLSTVGGSV